MADPRHFLLNTDYPLDKVVYLKEAFITFGVNETFAHNLLFTPLVKVVWSLTSNFSETYEVGNGPLSASPSTPFTPFLAYARANATDIELAFGSPGAVVGAYVRVYGFMPSNVNVAANHTASSADTFALNTDYNYSKMYLADITASSSVAGSTEVVTHGLGYYPQCEVWFEKGGYIWYVPSTSINDGVPGSESFRMTTSDITMYRNPFLAGSELFHYRIYLDEL